MAVILAIVILGVVILYLGRRGVSASGAARRLEKAAKCQWQQVDPETDRRLKEYRCSICSNVAYGHGDKEPAPRICRLG
ncbi:MAG: hypothetical protein AAF618_03830 [Pseudomonadota bacterium]